MPHSVYPLHGHCSPRGCSCPKNSSNPSQSSLFSPLFTSAVLPSPGSPPVSDPFYHLSFVCACSTLFLAISPLTSDFPLVYHLLAPPPARPQPRRSSDLCLEEGRGKKKKSKHCGFNLSNTSGLWISSSQQKTWKSHTLGAHSWPSTKAHRKKGDLKVSYSFYMHWFIQNSTELKKLVFPKFTIIILT